MNILHALDMLLGNNAQELSLWHLIFRSIIVYIVGIILARFNQRFLAFRTTNNFFLFILIGSILASSIVGRLFYETLGMAIFIIVLNWLVVVIGYNWPAFNILIEGNPVMLIDNGVVLTESLNKCFITERELLSLLRSQTNSENIYNVEKAYLEITGQISFILKKNQ